MDQNSFSVYSLNCYFPIFVWTFPNCCSSGFSPARPIISHGSTYSHYNLFIVNIRYLSMPKSIQFTLSSFFIHRNSLNPEYCFNIQHKNNYVTNSPTWITFLWSIHTNFTCHIPHPYYATPTCQASVSLADKTKSFA